MEKLKYKIIREEKRPDFVRIIFFRNDFNHYFEVRFAGNLDLYFNLIGLEEGNTFLIGKDNYEIYEIFDSLYKQVLNGCEFKITEEEKNSLKWECEMYDKDFAEELVELENRREKTRQKYLNIASYRGLIEDDKIIWRSDDFPDDSAPFLIIHKLPNAYELEFGVLTTDRNLEDYERNALSDFKHKFMVSVRFCNSGSRYEPFNTCFMHAYNKMLELDPEYHQIDIEEFMVDQEIEKGMSLERILRK